MLNASLQDHPGNVHIALPGPGYRIRILRNWVNRSGMANITDYLIKQVLYGLIQGEAMVLDSLIDHWYTNDKTVSVPLFDTFNRRWISGLGREPCDSHGSETRLQAAETDPLSSLAPCF
jgi:hypothetical protein